MEEYFVGFDSTSCDIYIHVHTFLDCTALCCLLDHLHPSQISKPCPIISGNMQERNPVRESDIRRQVVSFCGTIGLTFQTFQDGSRISSTTIHGPGVFVTCVKGKERLAANEIREVFEEVSWIIGSFFLSIEI